MEVAINSVSTSMDMLGNKMLENNVAEAQRNLQIQKVKQEIGEWEQIYMYVPNRMMRRIWTA